MSFLTHPFTLRVRRTLRRTKLAGLLTKPLRSRSYEKTVDEALLRSIKPADVVWDVGANLGHYCSRLSDAVGDSGRVVAFEPSPANLERLRETVGKNTNLSILPFGLSSKAGRMSFVQGDDPLGATSHLAAPSEIRGACLSEIELRRGDELVALNVAPAPDVIKIDVEGHELEVIEGLGNLLERPRLRALVIEVHFGILAGLGRPEASRQIELKLENAGFSLHWIDLSHLLATRRI